VKSNVNRIDAMLSSILVIECRSDVMWVISSSSRKYLFISIQLRDHCLFQRVLANQVQRCVGPELLLPVCVLPRQPLR